MGREKVDLPFCSKKRRVLKGDAEVDLAMRREGAQEGVHICKNSWFSRQAMKKNGRELFLEKGTGL